MNRDQPRAASFPENVKRRLSMKLTAIPAM
jgi:hypothetical protein